jgi:hypothetical protein
MLDPDVASLIRATLAIVRLSGLMANADLSGLTITMK